MNDVLKEPRIEEALEEDIVFFLRTLYIDPRSYNLRNDISHGIMPAKGFNHITAGLAMMSLILLAVIGPQWVFLPTQEELESTYDV